MDSDADCVVDAWNSDRIVNEFVVYKKILPCNTRSFAKMWVLHGISFHTITQNYYWSVYELKKEVSTIFNCTSLSI